MAFQKQVHEFREAKGLPHRMGKTPKPADVAAQIDFLLEELHELSRAARRDDFPEMVDALGDLVYYAYGAAERWGVDLDEVLAEIHRSNMTKTAGRIIAGKLEKSPGYGYEDPDIAGILISRGWEG